MMTCHYEAGKKVAFWANNMSLLSLRDKNSLNTPNNTLIESGNYSGRGTRMSVHLVYL